MSVRSLTAVRAIMGRAAIALISTLLLGTTLSTRAADSVHFAGFALAGDASETEKAFPITSRLLKEKNANGQFVLEELLWSDAKAATTPYILNRGLASGQNPSNAVSMAFVLDWENIAREHVAGSTKLVVDLHGQVLVFDFDSKKVIGSYPVAVQLLHTVEGESTPAIEALLVQSLYRGTNGLSIFRKFAQRLPSVKTQPSTGNYIRVVSVDVEDKAHQTLLEYGQNEAVIKSRLADSFAERLSENHRIAYVPYSKGVAVGQKMAARFANGDIYQLELPTPDYRVHLRLRGFKKVMADRTSVESAWIYGSYLNVAIKDFDDEKVYLDAPFKYGAIKKVVAGTDNQDDWSAYQESLFMLVDQITRQTVAPDKAWAEKWSQGQPVFTQLQALRSVLERSR